MRAIVLLVLVCILFFYILGHSFFIVNSGAILAVIAGCGVITYLLLCCKKPN